MYESLSIITLREQAHWDAAVQSDAGRASTRCPGKGALIDRALLRVLMGGDVPLEGMDDLAINFFSQFPG
jgi:hypothetical protein